VLADRRARGYGAPVLDDGRRAPQAGELAAVATVYCGLALWWLWPLPLHLATHSAYTAQGTLSDFQIADWYLIAWALAWGAHALVTDPLHLFDANAFHPAPFSLAFSDHFLGHQPLFAPPYWASGNAVLAVNLAVIGMFSLSALAFYALARRFVGGPAACVAGMLFSFCPWRHEDLFHLHLLGVQYLPLALLFTERWLERARPRDACLLAAALLLQALSSVYLAFALAVLYAPYCVLALWRWRARLDRRRLLGLGLVLAVALVVVAVASVPYVQLGRLGLIPSYGADEQGPAIGVVFARRAVLHYLLIAGVGPFGWALAALALLPSWRGRRWPLAIGILAFATGTLVASGSGGLDIGGWRLPKPFVWLVDLVPPLAAIRAPGRLVVVAHVGLCLLIALGLQRLFGSLRRPLAWGAAALVAGGLLASFSPLPAISVHREPQCTQAPEPYAWLAEHGSGQPLLELPPPMTQETAARRMYLGTCHWLPMVGGYSAYPPRLAELVGGITRLLPQPQALQTLVDTVDVGWIVVHLDELTARVRQRWTGALPDGLELAARAGDALVLRVTRPPGSADRRARLLSTRETLGGVPLTPLGAVCPGRLHVAAPLPALRAGEPVQFELLVTNQDDRAWPGFGLVPRHLLHLRICVTTPGTPCRTPPWPLGVDVPRGATRAVPASVTASPIGFGPRELRVELWQLGDGPLERCGTPPLAVAVVVGRRASR
jgi:hypothetical protein